MEVFAMSRSEAAVQTVAERYVETHFREDDLQKAAEGTSFHHLEVGPDTRKFLAGILIHIVEKEQLSFKVQPDGQISLAPRESAPEK